MTKFESLLKGVFFSSICMATVMLIDSIFHLSIHYIAALSIYSVLVAIFYSLARVTKWN